MMKTTIQKSIAIVFLSLLIIPGNVNAYTIEKHEEAPVENRFVVGPAKIEVEVSPGETKIVVLTVENRTGRRQTFTISFEDFVGSKNLEETVALLGSEKSDMSLKDFLFVEKKEFSLEQGDRLILPVNISLSGNASPGGKFGAILVSAKNDSRGISADDRAYIGTNVVGQVATLIFATVPGDTSIQGQLISFATKGQKKFFGTSNISVRLTYENTGNVNLNPYGGITVTNMFGKVVQKIPLDPWYALPDSLRIRDVVIVGDQMFGKYTATAQINRGYGDIVDEKLISYFVFPPGYIVLIIIFVIALLYGVKKIFTRNRAVV